MCDIRVRPATTDDARELLDIYAPYVRLTSITFECETPGLEEFTQRMDRILQRYPYLVLEVEGHIEGYAYASSLKDRAAYDWCCETSIYIAWAKRRVGLGKRLYEALEDELRTRGFTNLYACIAYPTTEDAFLTRDSVYFHTSLGYEKVGHFHSCGYKFDTWYDVVWMEKLIGEHLSNQPLIQLPGVSG